MLLILTTLGFSSIIGQVVLMRELVAVFYGNELAFGLILAWWLWWEAVGAWALGRVAARRGWSWRALALTMIVAALVLPLQIILTRAARDLMGVSPGVLVSPGQMFLALGFVLSPYCLAHGLAFSLGVNLLSDKNVGKAYAFESAGAVAGGALFSFLLITRLNPFQTLLLVTVVTIAAIIRQGLRETPLQSRVTRPETIAFLTLITGAIAALPLGTWLHHQTLARQWPNLVYSGDSRYGRLTVTASGAQRAFFENGLLAFETESTFPEQVVHLPLLAHTSPRRVLLIGGGINGDLVEIFKHDVAHVTYLELDPLLIHAARRYLPPEQGANLDHPLLTLVFQDGRYFVKHSRERFDVIIVDLPEPSTGQLNRFYTLEFFREIRAILADGGVFSTGLPSAENYWNPELTRRNASVYRSLRQVFPTVLVTPGDHNFFLATTGASMPTPEQLNERLRQRNIPTHWISPDYIRFLLIGDRFQATQSELNSAANVKLNRDLVPICYFYDLALWISRFGSSFRGFFETTSLLQLGWLALLLLASVLVLRCRKRATALALVGGTGFAGMALQIILLLAFQALQGFVYHQVGLLTTAFMAGLAAGAAFSTKHRATSSSRWLQTSQFVLMLYALALAALFSLGMPAPEMSLPFLATVAGALVGAIFPLAAALSRPGDTGAAGGSLYSADLMGGCIGALTTSVILIPVLGVVQTCMAVALIAAAGVLLSFHLSKTNPC